MIPKIIHYCWYGHNKKGKLILHCIESWREHFPDFDILEWNESNTDINENQYIRKAYDEKKWAFVSDYMRMKVLYEYGGIYFDTDVEVLKRFPDELLMLEGFTGIESFSLKVNPGLVFACHPQNAIVKEVLESYQKDIFENSSNVEKIVTINVRITKILSKYGFIPKDEKQTIMGLTIFPSEVFCAHDGELRKEAITVNSLSVHHYSSSWYPWYKKIRFKLGTFKRRLNYLCRTAIRKC